MRNIPAETGNRALQVCLLFCSGGMPVLLACPQVESFWPSKPALKDIIFGLHQEELTYLSANMGHNCFPSEFHSSNVQPWAKWYETIGRRK
jgi:hypothetical protein